MKRWELSNRKMAILLDMNGSNVDTLRRAVTQPSVQVLLKLESLTGIAARRLYEEEIDYSEYPLQPILGPVATEPEELYAKKQHLSDLPLKDFVKHVETLSDEVNKLRQDFDELRSEREK